MRNVKALAVSGLSNGHMPRMGAGCTSISLRLMSFSSQSKLCVWANRFWIQMEYPRDPVKLEQCNDSNFDRVPAENYSYRWYIFPEFVTHCRPDSPQYWAPPQVSYWDDRRCQSPDYCIDSPKTPPVGKYITIQPRSIDTSARDQRILYNCPFFTIW